MHSDFDPDRVDWDLLLINAQNEFPQFGGSAAYPVFHGYPYQRGAGIGALFKSVLRFLMPLGKEAGLAIGRQGMESTSRLLSNVLEGKPLKEALQEQTRTGVQNLLTKAADRVATIGSGKRRKRKISQHHKNTINSGKKHTNKKPKTLYASNFSPPIFPPNKSKKIRKAKGLRFDSLGPY